MPMLLEDLAEETSASNRRAADRLDAEARSLGELRGAAAATDELRQKAVESARQATDFALARVALAEGVWHSTLAALCKGPQGEHAERLLRSSLNVFESYQQFLRSVRALWEIAMQAGASAERLGELDQAEECVGKLSREASVALEHRAGGWQPADCADVPADRVANRF